MKTKTRSTTSNPLTSQPRRMWQDQLGHAYHTRTFVNLRGGPATPCLVVPLTPECIAGLHQKALDVWFLKCVTADERVSDIFAAIGLVAPKQRKP